MQPKTPRDIEDLLVWAYRDERVRVVEGLSGREYAPGFDGGGSGMAAVERIGRLGCRVDSGAGLAVLGADAPADALALHAMVLGLDGETVAAAGLSVPAPSFARLSFGRDLVIRYAELGVRPGWVPHPVLRCGPVIEAQTGGNLPVVHYRERRDAQGRMRRTPDWCPIAWSGDTPDRVASRRAAYAAWRAMLARLAAALRREPMRLKRWSVTGPAAPAAPWAYAAQGSPARGA